MVRMRRVSTQVHGCMRPAAIRRSKSYRRPSSSAMLPGLISRLLTTYPNLHAIDQRALVMNATMKNSDGDAVIKLEIMGAILSSEAWRGDRLHSSRASRARLSCPRYSSMLKPAVARSMCTRKITSFWKLREEEGGRAALRRHRPYRGGSARSSTRSSYAICVYSRTIVSSGRARGRR